jgi:hypothetical protein
MSQSLHAALNAFGLFAAGLLEEHGRIRSKGGGPHCLTPFATSGQEIHFLRAVRYHLAP